jgi:hypothetical protein
MKRLLLTTIVASALGAAAQAGTISLDARTDYEANTYNDAALQKNSTRFNLQTLRLDYKGALSDATSFRLRYRFNNPSSKANSSTAALTFRAADSATSALDFAYVEQKLMDNMSVQVGKFNTDIGGIEGLTSGADLYFTSQAYGEQSPLRYATGAKLMYKMNDQEIDLMAVNQETDAFTNIGGTTNSFSQNHEAYGIVYKGSFMDKALMPVVSWHTDKAQATSAAGNDMENNYYSAGLKYDFAPIFVELDYLYDTMADRTVVGETNKTTSIVGTVGARMDNWVAKLKAESSEAESFSAAATSGKNKYNGYQAAVEYLPANDKNFRYHVAYVTRDAKPETGAFGTTSTDTQTTQSVFAGVRILADFLK